MTEFGDVTRADIEGQVEAWVAVNRTLRSRGESITASWNNLGVDRVHVAGCGSVNFLSQAMAPMLQSATGVPCSSSPGAALLSTNGTSPVVDPSRTLLLVGSRSGETSEMIQAVEAFRSTGSGPVWCVTTRSESTLAAMADFVVSEDAGFEPSVVQTRSFSSMLAMMQGIARLASGAPLADDEALAAAGRRCLDESAKLPDLIGPMDRFRRVIFVASRVLHGLAQEGQLLMNEMALTDAVSHHLLDFRHGPISMVDSETLVIALLDEAATSGEVEVLAEAASFGGTVLTLTAGLPGPEAQPTLFVDPGGLGYLPLFMPPMQVLAHRRAIAKGINPDYPRHLSAVVRLDGAA